MFKTEEQINSRLSSEKNLANRFGGSTIVRVPDPAPAQTTPTIPILTPEPEIIAKPDNVTVTELKQPGNKLGKRKLGLHQRNEIAIRSRLGEGQSSLAQEFNVSQATIGSIERGRTKVDEETVNERLDDVQDLAMSKLLTSLGYISNDKMQALDPVKLSVVASNMSRIIGNIRHNDDNGPKVVVQIYAPELKKESSYKTLDV